MNYGDPNIYGGHQAGIYRIGSFVPRYLTDSLLSPTVVYFLGKDYYIAHEAIIFYTSPVFDSRITKELLADSAGVPRSSFDLWGFKVAEDIQAAQRFYGSVMGISAPSSRETKEAINVTYRMHADGVSDTLLNATLCLLSGTDPVVADGIIRDIYVEGDRKCIRTDTHIYTAPIDATIQALLGDSIKAGQTIFGSFVVYSPEEVLPASITELPLREALLPGFSDEIILSNSLVPITETNGTYTFPITATAEDEILFMANLNTDQPVTVYSVDACGNQVADVKYLNFFDEVAAHYGKVPAEFNAVDYFRKTQLSPNLVIIAIHTPISNVQLTCQLTKALHRTYPAGGALYFL